MVAHTGSQCRGNCAQHPLVNEDMAIFNDRLAWGWSWGGIMYEFDLIDKKRLSQAERAEKAKKEEEDAKGVLEAVEIGAQTNAISRYQEKTEARVKKMGQTKRAQPCKWCIGEFKGQECWAYEYTDPKTKKRMTPHKCDRIHPGEEGWCDEWFSNPRFVPEWAPKPRDLAVLKNTASVKARKPVGPSVSDW